MDPFYFREFEKVKSIVERFFSLSASVGRAGIVRTETTTYYYLSDR